MNLFFLLLCLMVLGFGAIAFVIVMEKKKDSLDPIQKKSDQPVVSPNELLGRLGLENHSLPKPPAKIMPLPELFKKPSTTKETQPVILIKDPSLSSASASVSNSANPVDTKAESELSLKYDELQSEHKELQERFVRLETLFTEKSTTLEKSEKTLNNELRNQKEFNKVKDLLEKELKEAKDKTKNLQADVSTAQTEAQTHLKRVSQLEEKVKKLEVDILTSEAAINDGQAGIQLARKRATELEEKLRANENVLLEKNQKIEDLVNRLNTHPATTDQEPKVEQVAASEPLPPPTPLVPMTPAPAELIIVPPPVEEPPPVPISEPEPATTAITEPPPPAPLPEQNVVDEGGETSEKISDREASPTVDTPPEEESSSSPPSGERESLSLPPDIFAKPPLPEEPPASLAPAPEKDPKTNDKIDPPKGETP